jgi:hypothetical protein
MAGSISIRGVKLVVDRVNNWVQLSQPDGPIGEGSLPEVYHEVFAPPAVVVLEKGWHPGIRSPADDYYTNTSEVTDRCVVIRNFVCDFTGHRIASGPNNSVPNLTVYKYVINTTTPPSVNVKDFNSTTDRYPNNVDPPGADFPERWAFNFITLVPGYAKAKWFYYMEYWKPATDTRATEFITVDSTYCGAFSASPTNTLYGGMIAVMSNQGGFRAGDVKFYDLKYTPPPQEAFHNYRFRWWGMHEGNWT